MSKHGRARPAAVAAHQPKKASRSDRVHAHQRARAQRRSDGRRRLVKVAATVAVAVGVLAAIFYANNGGSGGGGRAYAFEVADPKPGSVAPPLRLAATDGSTYDLAEHRGKTVLLYFQEGI